MFISLEGIDGSGKSTQARLLAETLRTEGREVVLTREPGGSPGAEQIRSLLVDGRADRWSAETELLLFTAARRDHLERTILPALDRGAWVVTDRFVDSSRVYQGVTRGDLRGRVDALHDLMIGIEPDRTFIIDLDPAIALDRTLLRQAAGATAATVYDSASRTGQHRADGTAGGGTKAGARPPSDGGAARTGGEDRFESMGLSFQRQLRAGFAALAASQPARIRLIDGTGDADDIAARVRAAL